MLSCSLNGMFPNGKLITSLWGNYF
uniref:Uncharacterized protein n=1 Tax=Anguilla anguilla TaxID=7936 RepID=A0A0E9QYG6_ANGAN